LICIYNKNNLTMLEVVDRTVVAHLISIPQRFTQLSLSFWNFIIIIGKKKIVFLMFCVWLNTTYFGQREQPIIIHLTSYLYSESRYLPHWNRILHNMFFFFQIPLKFSWCVLILFLRSRWWWVSSCSMSGSPTCCLRTEGGTCAASVGSLLSEFPDLRDLG
jgi:hypothetical protein